MGANVALVKMNAGQIKFEEGETVKGYLVGAGSIEIKGNAVPKVTLVPKGGGEKFAVLLGVAALETLAALKIGAYTEITKGASQQSSSDPKKHFCPYDVLQDADDMLKEG